MLATGPDDLFLQDGHVFRRQFHAEIAARDHHRIGHRNDFVEMFDGRRFFELGHNRRAAADQFAGFGNVGRPLDKAEPDIIRPVIQRELQILAILGAERRHRQDGVGNVKALVVGNPAARNHFGNREILARLGDGQAQLAVVDQDIGTGTQRAEHFGMRQ